MSIADRNQRAPRTLADCSFEVGAPLLARDTAKSRHPSTLERMCDVLLAVALGVAGALLLLHWAAA